MQFAFSEVTIRQKRPCFRHLIGTFKPAMRFAMCADSRPVWHRVGTCIGLGPIDSKEWRNTDDHLISLLKKNPQMSHEEFRNHYENIHAKMVHYVEHLIVDYQRNYPIEGYRFESVNGMTKSHPLVKGRRM